MSSGRTIIVGDIHGCEDEFARMLETVKYIQGKDKLVLVGDLVARGPSSKGVVSLAIKAGAQAVLGNHDAKVLSWWRVARDDGHKYADERVSISRRHQEVAHSLEKQHWDWLERLPLMLNLPTHQIVVVHAGVDPTVDLNKQESHWMLNIRSIEETGKPSRLLLPRAWAREWNGPEHIVFGHDARRGLQLHTNATGLDTGCCYGRELTALVLTEGERVSHEQNTRQKQLVCVPAKKMYCGVGDGNGPE